MSNNFRKFSTLPVFLFAIIFFSAITAFTGGITAAENGNIEGYVFPREAKPRVEIVLPHPNKPGDTIHRTAVPNAAGYFKMMNVPTGSHTLVYYPKEAASYKSTALTVAVLASQTVKAENVTLEAQ